MSLASTPESRVPQPGGESSGDLVSPAASARRTGEFDAAIFDLDGVVTRTAAVHAAAWKQMFDAYLRARAERHGGGFRPFTGEDYRAFVDGRPRYQGVAAFLQSRSIDLPMGAPDDPPDAETVCGLGNRKNDAFNHRIASGGVGVFESTVALMRTLRDGGVRLGLATSSRNAAAVLAATELSDWFGTVVDGAVSARLGLAGKPQPDIFVTAARDLAVPCPRAIVIEDAVAGVCAGVAGGFGLVIGVARENNLDELRASGADLVVRDLAETNVEEIGRLVRAKRVRA